MSKKNTILIAVLINAGLLAVLLITALTTQEEVIAPSSLLGDSPSLRLEEKPLFADAADMVLRENPPVEIPLPPIPTPSLAQVPQAAPAESLVHKLPSVEAPVKTAKAIPEAAEIVEKKNETVAASFKEVAVKKGDNLEKLAKLHHTTVDEILKLNHLRNTFLQIGQVLKIPAEKSLPKTAAAPAKAIETGPEYYTVKVGDNPWTIAMKHHMKVDELLKMNNLNEERARKLKAGDRLRIK